MNPCQAQELVVKQRHTTWNIANQQHGKTVSQKDINKKRTPPTKTYKNNVFIWKKSQDRSYQTTGSSHSHRYPSLLNDFETLDHFEHLRSALLESIASKSTMRAAFLFGTHVTPVWRTNKTSESKAPNKNKKKCVYIYIPSWTHDSSTGFSWWCNLQEFWILGSTILMANLGDLLMSWGSAMTSLSVPARCPLPSTSILSKIFCKSFLGCLYNHSIRQTDINKHVWVLPHTTKKRMRWLPLWADPLPNSTLHRCGTWEPSLRRNNSTKMQLVEANGTIPYSSLLF